jgi:diaminohydroxyphosphoribosylaminopyrimidine deaminase/5-amino-6-(5-phosphoribosylamino)uracil reductase
MTDHKQHMKRCLELAGKGFGNVAPNPMVGCVIVHRGQVIAEGYHRQYGGPHAEVDAISKVLNLSLLEESTLYVNLEPCSHHGKTPPCADLIIEKKIPYVVLACQDPNPLVAGKGIARLVQNGVDVKVGVLEEEALFLNRRFITAMKKQRPYIILKWAQSGDGFIDHVRSAGQEGPAGISSEESLILSHTWRSQEAAILVGTNTVLADDPQLTVRLAKGKNPVRVTFDRRERIPSTAKILDGLAPTIVFNAEKNYTTEWAEYIRIDFDSDPLHHAMAELHHRHLQSVLVEGGTAILNEFIKAGLWDEARVFCSPKTLGSGVAAPKFNFPVAEESRSGTDTVKVYYNSIV